AERNQAERGFAAEEFCAGFPVCNERSAGAVDIVAAQHAEPLWIAVCGVHADLRAGHFEGRCADAGIFDELGGSRCGDLGAAVCGAHALPWAGTMDCGDVDDLRGVPDSFFRSEELKAVRGGALHNGTCGYVADDSDEYADSEPCAG